MGLKTALTPFSRQSDRALLAQRSPSRPIFQGAGLAAVVASILGQGNVRN